MKKTSKNSALARIYGNGRGWAFSAKDFTAQIPRIDIDVALSSLVKENKIRRVLRGIYDYPIYSEILKKNVAPDSRQVANALARKFSWRIIPTGDTALNYLGLSTQLQSKYAFLSDGPSRSYKIDSQVLEFKHSALKDLSFKLDNSVLVVQSLKSVGENNITDQLLDKLALRFSFDEWEKIKSDTKNTTGWIHKNICKIISVLTKKNG